MRPTPSAAFISSGSLGAALATLISSSSLAASKLGEGSSTPWEPTPFFEPAPPSETVATPARDASPAALPQVQITAVGSEVSSVTLERTLGPALRSSFQLRFSSAHAFGPEELFRVRAESLAAIHVWVDTTTAGLARVYFANRDGTRFVVRTLKLSEPLDEMDREALAQSIEWSLQALAEGTEGLTRAEAEALFLEDPKQEQAQEEPALDPRRLASAWRRLSDGWLPEVAFLHGWAPTSSEMPATQGPVLRVGIDRLAVGHQLGFTVSAQYQYPQRHSEGGVALTAQTLASRFDVRYLATEILDGAGLGVRLGFGLDAVFLAPEALDGARFETTGNRLDGVPLFTGGLVWQQRVESGARFELSLGFEIDLVDVRYDVVSQTGTTQLLSRWPARPSLSVGVGLF